MRLLHVVAFSKKLRWLDQTKVITLNTQLHAVNARWKRLSQLSLRLNFGAQISKKRISALCLTSITFLKLWRNYYKEPGYCSIRLFWIVNPIQIHHKYVVDNPNFKIDWQSNSNAITITIQLFLEKRYVIANFKWPNFVIKPSNSHDTSLITLEPHKLKTLLIN